MNFFANFPVADLERSKAFFTALGWSINEAVTDDNAACFVLDDENLHRVAIRPPELGNVTPRRMTCK